MCIHLIMKTNQLHDTMLQCANLNMKKATRVVSKLYEEHLAPVGLKGTQFSLLMAVYSNENLTISQIAEKLVIDRTSLTRALCPLQRDGLVRIKLWAEDRRVRNVMITEKGKILAQKAIPLWKEAQTEFLSRLGEEQWNELYDLLKQVIHLKH